MKLHNKPLSRTTSISFLSLYALLFMISSGLILKAEINNVPDVYLPKQSEAVLLQHRMNQYFLPDEVIIATFSGTEIFAAPHLQALQKLSEEMSDHPLVSKVKVVTNQEKMIPAEDGFAIEPLVFLGETSAEPSKLRVASEKLAEGLLFSKDLTTLAVVVFPLHTSNSKQRLQLEDDFTQATEKLGLADLHQATGGLLPLDTAQLRALVSDISLYTPLTLLIGILLVWLLYRRWLAVVALMISSNFAIGTALACYGLFGQPITSITGLLPTMLAALNTAMLIHFFRAAQRQAFVGSMGETRIFKAFDEVIKPSLMTCLTTAIGLMSLGFSGIPPIRYFGLFGGVGILASGFSLVCFIYPLFLLFDNQPWKKSSRSLAWIDSIARFAFRASVKRPALTIGLVVGASILLIPQILKIKTETNFFEFFKDSHPISIASNRIEDKLSGLSQVRIMFSAPDGKTLFSPTSLHTIESFQQWALAQPEINKVISGVDYVKEMNWAFNAGHANFRVIPDSEALIQQYLFVYDGKDLDEFVSPDRSKMISSLSITAHDTLSLGRVIERIKSYLTSLKWEKAVMWEIGGHAKALVDQERLLVRGQLYSLISALLLIWIFLIIQTRSLFLGSLAMLPNMAPAMTMFIAMGIFGIHLDMATALVASLIIGIAVDDTIHIVHALQTRPLQSKTQRARSIGRALHTTGKSVISTTLVICAQFAVLTSSSFIPSAEYGLLCAIGLASALIFDLFLLPALVMVLLPLTDSRLAVKTSHAVKG